MTEPIDVRFMAPRVPVGVVALPGDGHEAVAVRSLLEQLGAITHLSLIGAPHDFVQVIGQGTHAPPYLVICAHGDESGFVFGEYDEHVDVSILDGDVFSTRELAKHVDLPETVVVNTACFGERDEMADAFLAGGARAYVGTTDGEAATVFLTLFFYECLVRGTDAAAAHRKAISYGDTLRSWIYRD